MRAGSTYPSSVTLSMASSMDSSIWAWEGPRRKWMSGCITRYPLLT